jgi:hypothetical protein
MKNCIACNKEKPFNDFYKSKLAKDGYSCYCRECCKDKSREGKKNFLHSKSKQIIMNMLEHDFPEEVEQKLLFNWKQYFRYKKIRGEKQLEEINRIMTQRILMDERISILAPGQVSVL